MEKFESWAIVEVMGHSRYAGFVTEQALGGCSFVRVDVPEVPAGSHRWDEPRPEFTKLLGQGSIFSITPCTEAVARAAAAEFRAAPMTMLDLPRLTSQVVTLDNDDDSGLELTADDDPREFVAE